MAVLNNENNDLNGHPTNTFTGSSGVSVTNSPVCIVKNTVTLMHLLARDKHKMRKSGNSLMCKCPFHDDSTPSFSVFNEGKSAKCFGCGWCGDIFDYEQQAHGVDFRTALERLEEVARNPTKYPADWLPPKSELKPVLYEPSPKEIALQVQAAKQLAEDHALCESIAKAREWQGETIQRLAAEGSLGWHEGALAFNYATGMKLRAWPDRKFWWKFGSASLWRSNQIRKDGGIILCEGETDAISLLDVGMGDEYSIVALPSATSIPVGLAELLKGRHVLLCMDDDEAGERASAKLIPLLLPSCASVSMFVYEEVQA